jgi:hypothetical protein
MLVEAAAQLRTLARLVGYRLVANLKARSRVGDPTQSEPQY